MALQPKGVLPKARYVVRFTMDELRIIDKLVADFILEEFATESGLLPILRDDLNHVRRKLKTAGWPTE